MFPLVILAAGMGSRLQSETLKPLQLIHGIPLIIHQINRFYRQGIRKFYIVTGYQESVIQLALADYDYGYSVSVEFISNPDWEKGNGTSVYAASTYLNQPFFLTMTDHIFSELFITQFLNATVSISTLVTDVLGEHNTHLDLEDVTKVYSNEKGYIMKIGKMLQTYNKIDTGLFYFTTEIQGALNRSQLQGNFSLSGGIDQLAKDQNIGTYDCNKAFWMDVDTPVDFDYAVSIQDKGIFV
jgi:choline kinase